MWERSPIEWGSVRLRYEGFEARLEGMRAMLPHVDEFLPVHEKPRRARTSIAARRSRPLLS